MKLEKNFYVLDSKIRFPRIKVEGVKLEIEILERPRAVYRDKDRLFFVYSNNIKSMVVIYDYSGNRLGEVSGDTLQLSEYWNLKKQLNLYPDREIMDMVLYKWNEEGTDLEPRFK